jgi:hypothetical protein
MFFGLIKMNLSAMNGYLGIPTFVINLKKRVDRKESIIKEFAGRDEFLLNIVEAKQDDFGPLGLWNTIRHILNDLISKKDQFIIICEDDHIFTEDYLAPLFFNCIVEAQAREADVLLGGVSWFSSIMEVSANLYWVENFSGLQFTVIFRKFFDVIQNASLENLTAADYKIASLSNNKMFIYPFISIQGEFGYSDATVENNKQGRVTELFNLATDRVKLLKNVDSFYKNIQGKIKENLHAIYGNATIPTYIICLSEEKEKLESIKNEFSGRREFDVTFIEPRQYDTAAIRWWHGIKDAVKLAIEKEDDVIILCTDNHQFTEHYSKEYLQQNIIEAHAEGVNYLSGATKGFGYAIPVTENRYWIDSILLGDFIVVYRSFFTQILNESFNETVVVDLFLSKMTSNKMVLYPFISTQKNGDHVDRSAVFNNLLETAFGTFAASASRNRLGVIQQAFNKYQF